MRFHGTMTVNGQDHLSIGGCDTVDLIREFGSPLHIMDEDLFRQNCREYHKAFIEEIPGGEVAYACKAFCCQAILRIVCQEDLGIDVVSGGELYTALRAGADPSRIDFNGNNKTVEEIRYALENAVGRIIVDNFTEIETLDQIAGSLGVRPKVLLRIQPGVAAHTHQYTQTGILDSKFGLGISSGQAGDALRIMAGKQNMELTGIHCHIGSQIHEKETFAQTAQIMAAFMAGVSKDGGFQLTELNLGGGFGIQYTDADHPDTPEGYAQTILQALKEVFEQYAFPMPRRISVEPGRAIVGSTGTTLYTVGSVKGAPQTRRYVTIDGGMTDNPRPALYQAKYEMCLANKMSAPDEMTASLAGRCCEESSDVLIWDVPMPLAEPGDIVAVPSTGAYHYAMSSNYNRVGRPAIVLVSKGKAHVIVKREDYADITRNDLIPAHLLA
ncbi:MAG: diaminopimelate decarboxylase [Clostridiales bacterium]|nr:diaminopimelate decarboxylase [Clostridiales bacterium]